MLDQELPVRSFQRLPLGTREPVTLHPHAAADHATGVLEVELGPEADRAAVAARVAEAGYTITGQEMRSRQNGPPPPHDLFRGAE